MGPAGFRAALAACSTGTVMGIVRPAALAPVM